MAELYATERRAPRKTDEYDHPTSTDDDSVHRHAGSSRRLRNPPLIRAAAPPSVNDCCWRGFTIIILSALVALFFVQAAVVLSWYRLIVGPEAPIIGALESVNVVTQVTPCILEPSPLAIASGVACNNTSPLFCPTGYTCPTQSDKGSLAERTLSSRYCSSETSMCGNLGRCEDIFDQLPAAAGMASSSMAITISYVPYIPRAVLYSVGGLELAGVAVAVGVVVHLARTWCRAVARTHDEPVKAPRRAENGGGYCIPVAWSVPTLLAAAGTVVLITVRPPLRASYDLAHGGCFNAEANALFVAVFQYEWALTGTVVLAAVFMLGLCMVGACRCWMCWRRARTHGEASDVGAPMGKESPSQLESNMSSPEPQFETPLSSPALGRGNRMRTIVAEDDDAGSGVGSGDSGRINAAYRAHDSMDLYGSHTCDEHEVHASASSSAASPAVAPRRPNHRTLDMSCGSCAAVRYRDYTPPRSPAGDASGIRWKRGRLLGRGAFGAVYLGQDTDTATLLAVKEIVVREASARTVAMVQQSRREMELLRSLSHPNIVRFIGTQSRNEGGALTLYLMMEYVAGGSLTGIIQHMGSIPESAARVYTRQILLGLEYLHARAVVHRDIKSDNVLLAIFDDTQVCKITDFGSSRCLRTLEGFTSLTGTPYYMAPEVVRQSGASYPADIWSVGATLYEMLTGSPPWAHLNTCQALFAIGTTTKGPVIPTEGLSEHCVDFLRACFNLNPDARATATELLRHPWFAATIDPLSSPLAAGALVDQDAFDGWMRAAAPATSDEALTINSSTISSAIDSPTAGQ